MTVKRKEEKSVGKPKVIITTDMERDDMNSILHLCLFLNELDVLAFIYTASQYHFLGDGVHTLGEVTPHYRTSGEAAYQTHIGRAKPDPAARTLKSYRPFPVGWLEHLWENEYAQVYPYLRENAEGYPSPEELREKTLYGNVAFEGDVREETEGSAFIRRAILDEDERILHLLSWGGANTIVRALLSIAEEYEKTSEWEKIYDKVCRKVRIWGIHEGIGQDFSYGDYAKAIFPDLKLMATEYMYGSYFSAVREQPDCIETFQPEWLKKHIKFNHGPLLEKYNLFGDGTYYEGEPERYQYGIHPVLDWGFDDTPPVEFEPYSFLGEGDSSTYIQLLEMGLRGLEDGRWGTLLGRLYEDGNPPYIGYDFYRGQPGKANRFLKAYQEEWAARAQWCVDKKEDCNHAPVVRLDQPDIWATPGEIVEIGAEVSDPDGDRVTTLWFLYPDGSEYGGGASELRVWEPTCCRTRFCVPNDAKEGEFFNFILEARDDAKTPMTRYGQVIVHVKGKRHDQ